MSLKIKEKNDNEVIIEVDKITIDQVNDYKKNLIKYLTLYRDLVLDMQNVEEIDIAGIQILIAAKNMAKSLGKKLEIINISNTIVKFFTQAGFNETILD